ncbi:NAD+--asparagine ADP-ribosyltransferase, partial [Paenibacillus popilliae ATCC 14706]
MTKNNDYWVKRALQRESESAAKGAALTTRMFTEYQRAAREIRRSINDFYARYASEQDLSYDEAVRRLSRPEMQEWKASIGDWVKRINQEQDEAVKALLKAELDALSYNSQISRLEALFGQIQMSLNDLYTVGVRQMRQEFGDLFTAGYYKKAYDIQQRVGFIHEFAKINEDMITNVLSYPWSGADFSARLWENKRML